MLKALNPERYRISRLISGAAMTAFFIGAGMCATPAHAGYWTTTVVGEKPYGGTDAGYYIDTSGTLQAWNGVSLGNIQIPAAHGAGFQIISGQGSGSGQNFGGDTNSCYAAVGIQGFYITFVYHPFGSELSQAANIYESFSMVGSSQGAGEAGDPDGYNYVGGSGQNSYTPLTPGSPNFGGVITGDTPWPSGFGYPSTSSYGGCLDDGFNTNPTTANISTFANDDQSNGYSWMPGAPPHASNSWNGTSQSASSTLVHHITAGDTSFTLYVDSSGSGDGFHGAVGNAEFYSDTWRGTGEASATFTYSLTFN